MSVWSVQSVKSVQVREREEGEKMNPFETATNDIFLNPDFAETALIGSSTVTVLASEVSADPQLSEFGLDEGVSFFLRVRSVDLAAPPKKNDLITFNGVEYRVASVVLDSSALVYRINLKSKSSR